MDRQGNRFRLLGIDILGESLRSSDSESLDSALQSGLILGVLVLLTSVRDVTFRSGCKHSESRLRLATGLGSRRSVYAAESKFRDRFDRHQTSSEGYAVVRRLASASEGGESTVASAEALAEGRGKTSGSPERTERFFIGF